MQTHFRARVKSLWQNSAVKTLPTGLYMQDGRMITKGLYRFYLYDNLSRVVVEGTCSLYNRRGSASHIAIGSGFDISNPAIRPEDILSKDSTDYLENFVFENDKPSKFLFAGGYYAYPANTANGLPSFGGVGGGLYFYLADHLGNNRVVVDSNDSIVQTTHYYPFGAVYADAGRNPSFQKYKYTGKELDLVHGLNTYDHGARQNYSVLGVWDRVDPMAEKYYNVSPYVVCKDKPTRYIDPFGMDYWSTNDSKEIEAFMSSIKNGDKYFDCSNWEKVSDNEFLSNAFYNDESGKFYVSWNSVENGQVFCYSKSFNTNIKINTGVDTKLIDFLDNAFGSAEAGFNNLSTSRKSHLVYSFRKLLKKKFDYKIPYSNSHIYRSIIPKVFKYGGKVIGGLSLFASIYEIKKNNNIRISNAIDFTMMFVGAIPVYGWAISGIYFLADTGLDFATDKGIGQHVNSIFGNDGVLYDFKR